MNKQTRQNINIRQRASKKIRQQDRQPNEDGSNPIQQVRVSKSGTKKAGLLDKYKLPPNVYDGSCIPPEVGAPNYYKLAEDSSEGKNILRLNNQRLATVAGVDMLQLASSYWKLLLGPTQFIYWDPSARNINNPKCLGAIGKWIFISTARDILEGSSPQTQCNNVIGGNGYLSVADYTAWYDSIFDSKPIDYKKLYNHFDPPPQGFVEFRKKCCWICGFPLYPGGVQVQVGKSKSSNPPCEHILPVVIGISNLKLYQKEDNSFTRTHQHLLTIIRGHDPLTAFTKDKLDQLPVNDTNFPRTSSIADNESIKQNYIDHIPQLNQLLKEYAWSHTCCNSIKSDDNLITTDISNNIYRLIPNEAKIKTLLEDIWDKGCFAENISFLNTVYIQTGKKLTIPKDKKAWIEARVENMYSKFLLPICNYANHIYTPATLLYNLASIASIVYTVSKDLRNLLLFSTISEDKITNSNVITYISLSDSISNIDTQGFKPNYQENANIVYSVANKIATVIQINADTTAIPTQRLRTSISRPVAPASEYIALLNNLFEVTSFTEDLINDGVSSQKKTNIPKYNLIIAESIYTKFININIYNFYKLLFIYLLNTNKQSPLPLPFPNEDCIKLASTSYYVLLYWILLNKIKPYLAQATPSAGTSNLLTKLEAICYKFYKNEIDNITNFLQNKSPEYQYTFKYYFYGLWPIGIVKPEDEQFKFLIPPVQRQNVTLFKIDLESQKGALIQVDKLSEPAESKKIAPGPAAAGEFARSYTNQGNAALAAAPAAAASALVEEDTILAEEDTILVEEDILDSGQTTGVTSDQDNSRFEQLLLAAKTEPEKAELSIDHETKTFQSSLDMLVNELEKIDKIPVIPLKPVPQTNITGRRDASEGTRKSTRQANANAQRRYGVGGRSTRKKGKKIKNKKRNTLKRKN
jgi:hypothetical protein